MSLRNCVRLLAINNSTRICFGGNKLQNVRQNSSIATEVKKATCSDKRSLYHTSIDDPVKHNERMESLFYTVPKEDFSRWMTNGLLPIFYSVTKSFGEACIMIRKPALEIFDNLKMVNEKLPAPKFMLYGKGGCGKSATLAHLFHHVGVQDWIIVHFEWCPWLIRNIYKDIQLSTYSKVPRVDQPTLAAEWLTNFKTMNGPLLKKLDLKTTKDCVWSKRDESKSGTPLLELIDLGLTRPKFATDIMGVILRELKIYCNTGSFKMLVAIDGINSLWGNTVYKREEDRSKKYTPDEVSTVWFAKKLIESDWNNGAIVCTVDGHAASEPDCNRYLPQDLLGKDGFETLEPFLPINVDNYSEKEFYSCMQYFLDNQWFIRPQSQTVEGQTEIKALSCMNPKAIYELGVWM